MVLRVGSRTIPLSGSVYHGMKHYDTRVQWQLGSSMPAPSVDFTREDHWTEYQTHLLYVDARNEIVVYEDLVRHEDTVGVGSAAASPPDVYWHQWTFDAPSQTTEWSTSRTIVLADQEYVLSSYTIEQEPQSPVYLENTGFLAVDISYCSDSPPVTSIDDRTEQSNVFNFYVDSIHEMINEGNQSLSAASRGSFVASLPIWKRLADGTYEQNGEWNHLSNGDLSTLLPVAPTHARYSPTGIVR